MRVKGIGKLLIEDISAIKRSQVLFIKTTEKMLQEHLRNLWGKFSHHRPKSPQCKFVSEMFQGRIVSEKQCTLCRFTTQDHLEICFPAFSWRSLLQLWFKFSGTACAGKKTMVSVFTWCWLCRMKELGSRQLPPRFQRRTWEGLEENCLLKTVPTKTSWWGHA